MMNRRTFLGSVVGSVAAVALNPVVAFPQKKARETMIGVQQYTNENIFSDSYSNKLRGAYRRTYSKITYVKIPNSPYYDRVGEFAPCDTCKNGKAWHATVWGQAICHDCYKAADSPCCQLYCGDLGLPPFIPKV